MTEKELAEANAMRSERDSAYRALLFLWNQLPNGFQFDGYCSDLNPALEAAHSASTPKPAAD